MSEDVEKELCSRTDSVEEPLKSQNRSEAENIQKKTLKCVGERFRSHPVLPLLLALLVLLVLALGVALAVQSGGRQTEIPVVADTGRLLACPEGWIGYRGICYFLCKDQGSWDQARARCSELGTSLAVLRDEEMEFLFHLRGKVDYWLGLRRRGEQLQWEDGSSFNSSVPVRGNAECVFLAEDYLGRMPCSNLMRCLCSRAQARL